MKLVYDPELLKPHQESLRGQRPGILEEVPAGLPQPVDHYLYREKRATGTLVRMALDAYETVTDVIKSGKPIPQGRYFPTVAIVKVKQFPAHKDANAEKTLVLSGMYGFKVHQDYGKPPKLSVFLRATNDDKTMATLGYYDLGHKSHANDSDRLHRSIDYPFMNESGTLGYAVAQDVARIALATLDRNTYTNTCD